MLKVRRSILRGEHDNVFTPIIFLTLAFTVFLSHFIWLHVSKDVCKHGYGWFNIKCKHWNENEINFGVKKKKEEASGLDLELSGGALAQHTGDPKARSPVLGGGESHAGAHQLSGVHPESTVQPQPQRRGWKSL